MKILIYLMCSVAIFKFGLASKGEAEVIKAAMTEIFRGFEMIDPENGKNLRNQFLEDLLQVADDNELAKGYNIMLTNLHDKGSPLLKETILMFNRTVEKVTPDELRVVMQQLRDSDVGKVNKKKRQVGAAMETSPVSYTLKDIPRFIYPEDLVTSPYQVKESKVLIRTNKDVPENFVTLATTANILEVILQKNHSEEAIEKIHKMYHSGDKNFEEIRKSIGSSILDPILQKNHSEAYVEKIHRMFHSQNAKKDNKQILKSNLVDGGNSRDGSRVMDRSADVGNHADAPICNVAIDLGPEFY